MTNEKLFIHDCDECIFLGRYENHDAYYHYHKDTYRDSLILRWGSEGSEYRSFSTDTFTDIHDCLLKRAYDVFENDIINIRTNKINEEIKEKMLNIAEQINKQSKVFDENDNPVSCVYDWLPQHNAIACDGYDEYVFKYTKEGYKEFITWCKSLQYAKLCKLELDL